MSSRLYNICLALMCLALFIYVVLKACTMSLTCDESSTLYVTDAVNFLDIWYKPEWFKTANNHILNSALIRISTKLFGWHHWSIRLPNILAYVLYLWASVKICTHINVHKIFVLVGVLILSASAFFMDFFCVARGYGIAASLSMAALTIYLTTNLKYKIWYCCALLGLAVLANFTYVNYFVAFVILINVCELFFNKVNFKTFLNLNIAASTIAIIIASICYLPIKLLMQNKEFGYGSNTLWVSMQDYVINFLYNTNKGFLYVPDKINTITICLILTPILGIIITIALKIKLKLHNLHTTIFTATFILITMLCITVLQKHLLNTMYLDERKSTIYTPLILLIWVCIGNYFFQKKWLVMQIIYSVLLSGLFTNFAANLNLNSCRQWWYNANSTKAILYAQQHKNNSALLVDRNIFYSMEMYNRHFYKDVFFHIGTDFVYKVNDTTFDFCYFTGENLNKVHPIYEPVLRLTYDAFLFQKNYNNYNKKTDSIKSLSNYNGLSADSILQTYRAKENWNLWLPIAK